MQAGFYFSLFIPLLFAVIIFVLSKMTKNYKKKISSTTDVLKEVFNFPRGKKWSVVNCFHNDAYEYYA